MRKLLFLIPIVLCLNQLRAQDDHGWHYLFDGKGVNELRGYQMDTFPDAWKVENGALVAQADVPNVDLVSKDTYTNFDLAVRKLRLRISYACSLRLHYEM